MLPVMRLLLLTAFLLCLTLAQPVSAQELRNASFQIQYDGTGIRSLKRTGDRYDRVQSGFSG